MAHTAQQPSPPAREQALRRRLGIPADAARAIVFAESSHWDPNWLCTSEEYWSRSVGPNLDRALEELLQEPRRIYSLECLFFLRLYWERQPQSRDKVRALVDEGRLRLTSSGVTTADTLLPRPEAILRDLLLGQEWLRAHGLAQEPRLAYFADSFGSSPALPSLLRAAGFDLAAITRVDGMFFAGADYESPARFPRPGSSAARLLQEERTLDFVWRGPDGAEVLCHWNAFTYGQGDLLAHRGISRTYIIPLAGPDRSERHVARRIRQYVAQLAPLSRTPYLFCPIGFDFVGPIPGLVSLLDRYNRLHYPTTGIWAVNAGLDDYLALVDCHRGLLPTLELDPNPYWTGFYASRPTLKRQCHELVDSLLLAERLALLLGNEAAARTIAAELEPAWWDAATANHHDFITGTSPDRVVDAEQRPWLRRAAKTAGAAVARLTPPAAPAHRAGAEQAGPPEAYPASGRCKAGLAGSPLPGWRQDGGRVEVHTPHYCLEFAEDAGGAIVRAWCPATQAPLLAGPSNDLLSYRDSGGLWRMGHEFRGGVFRPVARAAGRPARLAVREHAHGLEVECTGELDGEAIRRLVWLCNDSPLIRFRLEGRAARGRTLTVRFATGLSAGRLAMDTPGGVVVRPPQRVYDPTFWPLQGFWHAHDDATGRGLALCLGLPGAVAYRPGGTVEAIALRNATRERAWGVLPLLATPATGHERAPHAFEYALLFTPAGDWRQNRVHLLARALAAGPWEDAGAALRALADSIVTTDRPDVWAIAAKPASRGEGVIVRLYTLTAFGAAVTVRLAGHAVQAAWLCDARERDLGPLAVHDGAARLAMPGAVATLRLIT